MLDVEPPLEPEVVEPEVVEPDVVDDDVVEELVVEPVVEELVVEELDEELEPPSPTQVGVGRLPFEFPWKPKLAF